MWVSFFGTGNQKNLDAPPGYLGQQTVQDCWDGPLGAPFIQVLPYLSRFYRNPNEGTTGYRKTLFMDRWAKKNLQPLISLNQPRISDFANTNEQSLLELLA